MNQVGNQYIVNSWCTVRKTLSRGMQVTSASAMTCQGLDVREVSLQFPSVFSPPLRPYRLWGPPGFLPVSRRDHMAVRQPICCHEVCRFFFAISVSFLASFASISALSPPGFLSASRRDHMAVRQPICCHKVCRFFFAFSVSFLASFASILALGPTWFPTRFSA